MCGRPPPHDVNGWFSVWCLLLSALALVYLATWHWWNSVADEKEAQGWIVSADLLMVGPRCGFSVSIPPLCCVVYRFRQPSVILLLFVGSWRWVFLAEGWCSFRAPTTLGLFRIHRPIKGSTDMLGWSGARSTRSRQQSPQCKRLSHMAGLPEDRPAQPGPSCFTGKTNSI